MRSLNTQKFVRGVAAPIALLIAMLFMLSACGGENNDSEVGAAAESAYESAHETAEAGYERAHDAAEAAMESAHEAFEEAEEHVESMMHHADEAHDDEHDEDEEETGTP